MANNNNNNYNIGNVKGRFPKINDVIRTTNGKRYRLIESIGAGGYGAVFKAHDEVANRIVALKAEQWERTALNMEISVLRRTTQAASTNDANHFCRLIDHGKQPLEYMFMVMSILGPDLAKLRNEQYDRKFTLPTAVRIGMQTLSAISELHQIGFISRDIKPGNFAIGNLAERRHRTIYMFDFGLSRKYLDRNHDLIPSRGEIGWRGTTRYGSLQAHLKRDLGRKDDIESWFYGLVELTKGYLPWRLIMDRPQIEESKKRARVEGRKLFLSDCPAFYDQILSIIDGLDFYSTPPYFEIQKLFATYCKENDFTMEQRYDWEINGTNSSNESLEAQIIYQPQKKRKKTLMPLKEAAVRCK